MLRIERCVKPPGFIFAARTYRLVQNDKGLYLIHIGRAMGPKARADNAIADALAQKMISRMESKLMQKLAQREADIDDHNLDRELGKSSKSRHFAKPEEVVLALKIQPNGWGKLRLKGKGVKLRLDIHPQDVYTAQLICEGFKV
jgi:hypothetical protein